MIMCNTAWHREYVWNGNNIAYAVANMLFSLKSDWVYLVTHYNESDAPDDCSGLWDSTFWRVIQNSPNFYSQSNLIHKKHICISLNFFREPHTIKKKKLSLSSNNIFFAICRYSNWGRVPLYVLDLISKS